MKKHFLLIVLLMFVVLSPVFCQAVPVTQTYGVFDVTFYDNNDSDGYVTGQGDWTSQQMADVAASITAWQNYIGNTAGRQIKMHAFWNELDSYGTNVLGGSSSVRVGNGTTIWNAGEYVWKEGGSDDFGFVDTLIQYDITAAGFSWNFGSETPVGSEIDFRSVITHEIGHSLGWDTTYDNEYDDWGWLNAVPPGYYGLTDWDKNLVDSAGNRAQNGTFGTPGNFNETDNPVYFDGANAVALYGGPVPICAPASFSPGSSLVHLDEVLLGNYLMSPAIGLDEMIRTVSDLEWAMMEDMGWTIIPEPATILLFGLGGLALLRNRRFR